MDSVREKEVLNVEEAAEFLGFAPYTIREKAREGQIPGRKIGGEWRFSREALLEWVKDGQAQRYKAPVVVLTPNPEGSGYLATIQGVPDVRGQGETAEEALRDIRPALEAASYAQKYRTEL